MADEIWTPVIITIILLIVALALLILIPYLVFKYLGRRRSKIDKIDDTKDQAYNALITTRAIMSNMERSGVRSDQAKNLLRQAEEARAGGDHAAVIELAESARNVLIKEKQRQKQIGDMAKLSDTRQTKQEQEPTTKEKLEKEVPKNYIQAKFMLSVVQRTIEDSQGQERDVTEAARFLALARKSFDEKDYDSSLKYGVQAKKMTEEVIIEIKPGETTIPATLTVEATPSSCVSCGTPIKAGDTFCRKCGVKIEVLDCPSCGTRPREGDTFCRKCGVTLRP